MKVIQTTINLNGKPNGELLSFGVNTARVNLTINGVEKELDISGSHRTYDEEMFKNEEVFNSININSTQITIAPVDEPTDKSYIVRIKKSENGIGRAIIIATIEDPAAISSDKAIKELLKNAERP